jgi:hypothetical protein
MCGELDIQSSEEFRISSIQKDGRNKNEVEIRSEECVQVCWTNIDVLVIALLARIIIRWIKMERLRREYNRQMNEYLSNDKLPNAGQD